MSDSSVPRWRQRPPRDPERPRPDPTTVEGMMRLIARAILACALVIGPIVLVWLAVNMVVGTFLGGWSP